MGANAIVRSGLDSCALAAYNWRVRLGAGIVAVTGDWDDANMHCVFSLTLRPMTEIPEEWLKEDVRQERRAAQPSDSAR